MTYAPDALEAVRTALTDALAACEAYDPELDSAPLDEALATLEKATTAMQGEVEEEGEDMDMSKMDMAAKSPEDKATLKAKLAKAAFGGY
jgi:hypothetical protein